MASEKAIDARIQKAVRRRGAWSFKVHGSPKMRRGIPDRIVCYRGRFIAVEVKQPGGTATELQRHELNMIDEAGGVAIVATDVETVEAAMDQVDAELDRVQT